MAPPAEDPLLALALGGKRLDGGLTLLVGAEDLGGVRSHVFMVPDLNTLHTSSMSMR
jgi:hypothetical protein